MRNWSFVVLVLVACQNDKKAPGFVASCAPIETLDVLECKLTNNGAKKARACVTARVWVPKTQPLVAQRLCAMPEPGQTVTLKPKFDRVDNLQTVCAPEGKWICKAEVAETPEQLGENIAD